jgi:hypothetical protein
LVIDAAHYIMMCREVPPEAKVEVISDDLKHALAKRGNPELRPRDKIFVCSFPSCAISNFSRLRTRRSKPAYRRAGRKSRPRTRCDPVSLS